MIPFRDNIRPRLTPVFTKLLIVINIVIFAYELSLGEQLDAFFRIYGVTPVQILSWSGSAESLQVILQAFGFSMFLHGGVMHLAGNMWFLWIFGDNIEDRFGHIRFLLFYLACGFVASLVHIAANPASTVPSIGASGAIAGVLGAYLVSYPFAKVLTLVPIFFFVQIIEIPALIVLGSWFVFQFLYGASSLATPGPGEGGVAWWAHVGGFACGVVLTLMARKPPRPLQKY